MAPDAPDARRRSSLLNLLKVLLGLTVLVAVVAAAPWEDVVLVRRDGVEVARVAGELEGVWSGARASFRIARDEVPAPVWPEGWAEARAAGRAIALERDLELGAEAPLDWQPGLPRVLSGLEWTALLLGLLAFLCGLSASVVRWWRLLALVGCDTPFLSVFRLTFLGLFFNLVVPGLTGGDLVKVVLCVRENPERRADAFVSAVVDRILGLTGLLTLASGVVLLAGERLAEFRTPILLLTSVALVSLVVIVHPAPRRLVRLERWIRKLPQARRLESLDRAVQLYGAHPFQLCGAFLISVFNHLCNALGIFLIAGSMGSTLDYPATLSAASLSSLFAALPITPGGLGVEAWAYSFLFGLLGESSALGLGVGLAKSALFTLLGLAGGLFLLAPSTRGLRGELEAARETVA